MSSSSFLEKCTWEINFETTYLKSSFYSTLTIKRNDSSSKIFKFYSIVSRGYGTPEIPEAVLIPDSSYTMLFPFWKNLQEVLYVVCLKFQNDIPYAGHFSSTVKQLVPLIKQIVNLETNVLQIRKLKFRDISITQPVSETGN